MESLIWSAILSGWPSVTDSDVKRRRDTRYSLGSVTVGWTPAVSVSSGARYRRVPEAVPGSGQPGGDDVPDAGGHGVLAALGQLGDGPVGGQDDGGVLGPADHPAAGDVVDHEQVPALQGQLDRKTAVLGRSDDLGGRGIFN